MLGLYPSEMTNVLKLESRLPHDEHANKYIALELTLLDPCLSQLITLSIGMNVLKRATLMTSRKLHAMLN